MSSATEGPRPGGAPPSPTNPPDGPPKGSYAALSGAEQRRFVELLRHSCQNAVNDYLAERPAVLARAA